MICKQYLPCHNSHKKYCYCYNKLCLIINKKVICISAILFKYFLLLFIKRMDFHIGNPRTNNQKYCHDNGKYRFMFYCFFFSHSFILPLSKKTPRTKRGVSMLIL